MTTITIDAAVLREALARCVSDTSTPEPIYRHVLFGEWTDGITLTSTDSMMTYRVNVEADVQGESPDFTGNITMLRAALYGLTGPVTIEHDGKLLKLRNEARRYRIDTLPGRAFPVFDDLPKIDVAADPLQWAKAIDAIQYAAPTNSGHYALNGVHLDADFATASDAHALAYTPVETHLNTEIILPVASLRKGLTGYLTEATKIQLVTNDCGTDPVAIEFTDAMQSLRVQLVAHKYPGFRAQLPNPEDMKSKTHFNPRALGEVLQRMMAFLTPAGVKKARPTLILNADGERLEVKSKGEDVACDYIACSTPARPMQAALDGLLVKALLNQCDDEITWHSDGPDSIQAFTMPKRDDTHYIVQIRI